MLSSRGSTKTVPLSNLSNKHRAKRSPSLPSAGVLVSRNHETMKKPQNRPDRNGPHRMQFEANKRIVLATQDVCGICGRPVDKTLRSPHPLSAVVDHIIPVAKGGHPSDISNLQLAHRQCNAQKSDKLSISRRTREPEEIDNRLLPQSVDWRTF